MPRRKTRGTTQLSRAREMLSEVQLLAFFTAEHPDPPYAMRLVQQHLSTGSDLDTYFREHDDTDEQVPLEVVFTVHRRSPRSYTITYGYNGADVGDGGEWTVVYTAKGAVRRMELLLAWIH